MDSTTTAPPTSAEPTTKPGILINRNFGLLWIGQSLSLVGDFFFDTTLLLWVTIMTLGQPWAPLALSGIALSAGIPAVVFGAIGGVVADRVDQRRMMLWADGIRALIAVSLILATNWIPLPFLPGGFTLPMQLIAIYSTIFLLNACAQFFAPARFSLIGTLVPEPYRPQASSLTQITLALAGIIGPLLAPILFVTVGKEVALLINAGSFLWSFVFIALVRYHRSTPRAEGQPQSARRDLIDGLRYALTNRYIAILTLAFCIIMLGATFLNTLDILFVLNRLHAPVQLYGLIGAVGGIAVLVGAIIGGILGKRFGLLRMTNICVLVLSVGILIYSRLTDLWIALVLFGLFGLFQGILNVVTGPLLMRITPLTMLGRVSSFFNTSITTVVLVSSALAGYLAGSALQHLNTTILGLNFTAVDTLFTIGGVLGLTGWVYMTARLGWREPAQVANETA